MAEWEENFSFSVSEWVWFPIFLAQITKLVKKRRDFSFRAMGWTWFKVFYWFCSPHSSLKLKLQVWCSISMVDLKFLKKYFELNNTSIKIQRGIDKCTKITIYWTFHLLVGSYFCTHVFHLLDFDTAYIASFDAKFFL